MPKRRANPAFFAVSSNQCVYSLDAGRELHGSDVGANKKEVFAMNRHALLMLALLAGLVLCLSPAGDVPAYADMIYGTPGDDIIEVPPPVVVDGIETYGGDDTITVHSVGQVNSVDQAGGEGIVDADATATGIDAGEGDDRITSDGTEITADVDASATAVGVSLTVAGSIEGGVVGEALSDSSATADAVATGIDGGGGKDTIDNRAKIFSDVDSTVTPADVAVSIEVTKEGNVSGAALSDASATASAAATGIDGGEGADAIDNRGDMELLANSYATGVAVSLDVAGTVKGDAAGSSVSDASVTANASATGIAGGEGDDTITNDETEVTADADADAAAVGVALTISGSLEGNIEGEALSDSSATANATATGIDGGGGNDTIENRGKILADADSTVTAVEVAVNIEVTKEGNAEGAALSDASVTANAAATGIDGGEGKDEIDNAGDIELLATSEATAVAVGLTIDGSAKGAAPGAALSDASVTANTAATGVAGGEGDDTIVNDGTEIAADVDSTATAVGVSLTVTGSLEGNVAGKALSDASSTAEAAVTGIGGGGGNDTIDNRATILADVDSTATTVGVGADVGIAIEEGGNASGAALSDSSVTANAAATGIDGGEGADAIDNRGDVDLKANSDATGVAVSLTVAGAMKGDAAGSSVSDASVTAESAATGIDGGDGDDTIVNEGMITLMS
ncbi:MAG: hypothetical protein HWN71_09955, partial [Desulfobacterales bacterium]|nr:hypothetical protein [Desulfobacterales bacterium]